jgi:hypothetical protein
MNRLALIAVLFVVVWYLWWRVRRRIAAMKASFRGEQKRAEAAPGPLTLEKDPVTGVYRPPKR